MTTTEKPDKTTAVSKPAHAASAARPPRQATQEAPVTTVDAGLLDELEIPDEVGKNARAVVSTPTARTPERRASSATAAEPKPAPAVAEDAGNSKKGSDRELAVLLVKFLAGLAVIVGASFAVSSFPEWSEKYGDQVVFLGFFFVMATAGILLFGSGRELWGRLRHPRPTPEH